MFKDLDFKDLGERCIATFVETFIAMITAEGTNRKRWRST